MNLVNQSAILRTSFLLDHILYSFSRVGFCAGRKIMASGIVRLAVDEGMFLLHRYNLGKVLS